MYATLPSKAKPSKSVSKDQTRPILTHAELRQTADDSWELVCCDSYQLARVPLTVKEDNGEALTPGPISTEALKALEKTGSFRANGTVVPVTAFGGDAGPAYPRPTDVGTFPDWDGLAPEAPLEPDAFTITLNPTLLASLAASLGSRGTVTLRVDLTQAKAGAQVRPIMVAAVGTEFNGLLMPVRPPS